MRDFTSCFSENAIHVSPSSCSSHSNTNTSNACFSQSLTPVQQNSVSTCVYKIELSPEKQLLITVSWCRNHSTQGLSINMGDGPRTPAFKLNTNARLFRKNKGSKFIESDNSMVEVIWDLSNAKYDAGSEPVEGFYVMVIVNSQIALVLGDMKQEALTKKSRSTILMAKASLISRRDRCSGNGLFSTKAQFSDSGTPHDILIRFSGDNEGRRPAVLSVCIDKKTVIRIKRVQWNFRGNQTILVDGLLVDMLWDVHNWLLNPASGDAVFMFRTRTGLDSKLWIQEKSLQQENDKVEFSLLIYASKCA